MFFLYQPLLLSLIGTSLLNCDTDSLSLSPSIIHKRLRNILHFINAYVMFRSFMLYLPQKFCNNDLCSSNYLNGNNPVKFYNDCINNNSSSVQCFVCKSDSFHDNAHTHSSLDETDPDSNFFNFVYPPLCYYYSNGFLARRRRRKKTLFQ